MEHNRATTQPQNRIALEDARLCGDCGFLFDGQRWRAMCSCGSESGVWLLGLLKAMVSEKRKAPTARTADA